ncbi:MAG: HEAT repeat domain-containing protein [Coxiellaceae bacterium]|nr:MAG: HEAT repeat domain-containing protein [Coxiellaceae bacterium]
MAIIEVLAVFSPFSPDKAIEIIRILFNLNKNDPMIRATVITAIANLLKWAANNDISETVEKLFKFFDDPANNVRTATIMALGNPRWSNDIYYKNLLKVLHNKEEHLEVKEAAIRKLSELKRHFKTHVMMEVVKATLAIAKDENHLLSHLCIWLLGELGKETVDVINVLLKMLTSYELKTKITAAKALGKLGVANATIIDALIIALQDKESSMIKATNEALIQLFLISPELVTQKLIYHLENKINSANEAAILILLGKLFSTETCQIYLEKTLPPRMQPKTVIELPYPIINHVLSLVDDKSLDETRDINREWYRIYRNHKSNYRRHFSGKQQLMIIQRKITILIITMRK